jgi:MOSC domain-containing protein YiiM
MADHTPTTRAADRALQLADDLAACVERILGEQPGTLAGLPADRAFAVLGERLATRNLGLARVADAARFAWPGHWIAVVETPGGTRRAALFFGVPSGPLDAADAAIAGGAAVVDGYLVAPLDLHTRHDTGAYGSTDRAGTVVALFTAPAREAPSASHARCVARAGRGLDGDRYAEGCGTFSHPQRGGQDLTLIEAESLDGLAAHGLELTPADARRNVVTRGIRLNGLVGHRFAIGDVVCFGARLAEPCAHLERLTTPGVLRGLVHRGGIRADVLEGGELRVGDAIRPLPATEVRR